jgi:hypothetical protein
MCLITFLDSMNIPVEHIDNNGNINLIDINISRLALVKHLAIAGQGFAPRINKLMRFIGMAMHYSFYLQKDSLDNNHFSLPPDELSDPTEKGQFSCLVGKAIADYLSKRISNGFITLTYEAALRILNLPISGQRPDLISFTQEDIFAIEAKGSSDGPGNMINHKTQAQTGPIPVNFSIASVSYNLYDLIQCNYHDPTNINVPYNEKLLKEVSKLYYSGIAEFLNKKYFDINEINFNNEDFYEIQLNFREFQKMIFNEYPPYPIWFFDFLKYYKLSLLVPKRILSFANEGISRKLSLFSYEKENNVYIDYDRIGIKIR